MSKQLKVAMIILVAIHVLFTPIPASAALSGTPVSCEAQRFSLGQPMVLASSGQALFKLSETGWTRLPVPGIWDQVRIAEDNTVYLYSNETHNVFRSRDGGLDWSLVTTLFFSDYAIRDFYVAPDDHHLFLSGNSTFSGQPSIWRSLDDGATWQRTLDLSEYSLSILSPLAFPPAFSQDGTVFLAQIGRGAFVGVWKSSDFGLSWSRANSGMQVPAQYSPPAWLVISPQFTQDNTVFSGGAPVNQGFYKSTDAGTTWQFSGTLRPIAAALSPSYLADQVILMADAGTGVYVSADGGASFANVWRRTGALIVGLRHVSAPGALDEVQSLEYWVVAQGAQPGVCFLYRSLNQGQSWAPQVLFEAPHAVYLPMMRR